MVFGKIFMTPKYQWVYNIYIAINKYLIPIGNIEIFAKNQERRCFKLSSCKDDKWDGKVIWQEKICICCVKKISA